MTNRFMSARGGRALTVCLGVAAIALAACGPPIKQPPPTPGGISVTRPDITSLNPAAGAVAGGNSVVLNGAGFTGATAVSFGGSAATFAVDTASQITATAPAGSAGTVDVTVTGPAGTSINTAAVSLLAPGTGVQTGGTTVVITGTNFSGPGFTTTAVSFGSNPAAFTVDSPTRITATSPAGTGAVEVAVTTPGGTSADNGILDDFTYAVAPPTVLALVPPTGPASGGNSVTIAGFGFTGATDVKFGSNSVGGGNFTVNNDSQITAAAPAGTGTVGVSVTTPAGTSADTPADDYTYAAPGVPIVLTVLPPTGPAGGGSMVTIAGSGFTGVTDVKFGGTSTAFVFNNDSQITVASVPPGTGTVSVTVLTPGGTSADTPADDYTYLALGAPTVVSVLPPVGQSGGGNAVAVAGTGFTGFTAVMFGATAAICTFVSDSLINCTAPAGTMLTMVDVLVTTPGGTSANTPLDNYTYTL